LTEETEIWKIIPDYPAYRVSNFGRVQSSLTKISFGKRGIGEKWRDLKPQVGRKGYHFVNLYESNTHKSHTCSVQRLITKAFIPNPENKPVVRHLDGNKTNNHVSNLAWGTYKENEHDKKRHGTWDSKYTTRAKLSTKDVNNIRLLDRIFKLMKGKMFETTIAQMFGVNKSSIYCIVDKNSWSHISIDEDKLLAESNQIANESFAYLIDLFLKIKEND
jgi:hypothetical protein